MTAVDPIRQLALGPAWLQALRREAWERFSALGYPTTRMEEWRFTNVTAIARAQFAAPPRDYSPWVAAIKAQATPPNRLVFVDGRYAPELSAAPAGVRLAPLAEAESHLGRYASFQDQAFAALNTASFEYGAFLTIPRGEVVEQPVYLLHFSTGGNTASHPRTLILAGAESQAAVVERYLGVGPGAYFCNAVTEIVAGPSAVLEHYMIQQHSDDAFHVGTLQVRQERSSNVTNHNVALGARLARNDINFVLDGEGAEAHMYGLYVVTGDRHVDNHTTLDNVKPHCPSRELYKGIMDGHGSAVFNGGIIVRPGAQKTDAKQSNKNLLLSRDAVINTKPQLQIWADDVKCTHGATIGQIDEEALFYLCSRGIGRQEARRVLTFAFTNDLLMRMKVDEVRQDLEAAVLAVLGG